MLRNGAEAAAPVLFGFLAEHAFGGASGLRNTFLVMLAPPVAAAVVTLAIGRRTYPADVAATTGSAERSGAATAVAECR